MSFESSLDSAEIPALCFVDILVNLSKKTQTLVFVSIWIGFSLCNQRVMILRQFFIAN